MKSDKFYRQDTKPDLQEKQLKAALPAKIGPYKIESLLSKGGMSLLYLGLHPETNTPIAIKVLLPKYVKNKEVTSLFLKEAEIIKMTNHPNIVQLYGEGEWEKGLYIAMEFIQGVSLRQFIQHKSLNLKRALEIVLQVAYALCHLHVHGVIHRDLKPENILITETGQVKVIDFGIALLKGEENSQEKKRLMGTPVYMSPEQKTNPNKWSQNSDIYALGVITYELVLGRLSHGSVHLSLLPKRLASIIDRALKMEYHDVVEFITEVSQYIKTLDEEEKPETLIANNLLLPKTKPKWPPIDLGAAIFETDPFNGLYLDFFALNDNRYCIVLAEPKNTRVPQVQSLDLRGMIRMGVQKEKHLPTMMQTINQILLQDQMEFAVSMLMLYPDKDRLSFISCGFSDLWHIPEGSRKIRSLTTPNPLLGKEKNGTFLEVEDNWQFGDTLVFHSTTLKPTGDYELLSLQHSAESILQKAKTQTTAAVLTIARK